MKRNNIQFPRKRESNLLIIVVYPTLTFNHSNIYGVAVFVRNICGFVLVTKNKCICTRELRNMQKFEKLTLELF